MLTSILTIVKTFVLNYKIYFIIGGLIFVIALAVSMYSCLQPKPTINEAEIQQAQKAIADQNDQKLKEILGNSDARVQQAEGNINAAEANTAAAQDSHQYDGWTTDQLAQELEKRAKQP